MVNWCRLLGIKNKKIYRGKFVERTRLYAWVDPAIEQLLNLIAMKLFPQRKKVTSLIIQKLIIDEALRLGILDENSELYKRVMKIKEIIEHEISSYSK